MFRRVIIVGVVSSIFCASGFFMAVSEGQQPSSRRKLGPGVLRVIPTSLEEEETVDGALPIPEIVTGHPTLQWTPNFVSQSRTVYERAKQVHFRRAIWGLEFTFKLLISPGIISMVKRMVFHEIVR